MCQEYGESNDCMKSKSGHSGKRTRDSAAPWPQAQHRPGPLPCLFSASCREAVVVRTPGNSVYRLFQRRWGLPWPPVLTPPKPASIHHDEGLQAVVWHFRSVASFLCVQLCSCAGLFSEQLQIFLVFILVFTEFTVPCSVVKVFTGWVCPLVGTVRFRLTCRPV
jgi:hypothetical protein